MKLLPLLAALVLAAAAAVKDNSEYADKELPPELTAETFDSETADSLTFVEFYSPYCPHCKQLAPVWKEAFFKSEEEQKNLKIQMRQVNCVDSGDLCEREGIAYYPNLRLYSPDKEKPGKSKFVDTFPRALTRTPENFRRYLINSVAVYNADAVDLPSSSEEVDVDLGMQVVAGELEEPFFMSIYSSSTKQSAEKKYPGSCMNCVEHRLKWDKLSNLVSSISRTGHLNCHSHAILCKKLGFPELVRKDLELSPRYVMFLPKDAGLIRFDYTPEDVSVQEMKHYVTKLANNYQYSKVTARDLEDFEVLVPELPNKAEDFYYPLSNQLALVFHYEQQQITPEDKAILPYILEMVTNSPFDISLYVSRSNKLSKAIETQAKGLYKFVNSDVTWEHTHEFDRKQHLVTSMSNKPTLYMFKEHSLVPSIYQNFALEAMRKPEPIQEFIKKNQFPLYGELTPSLVSEYFPSGKNVAKTNDKVVITFLSSSNGQFIKDTLFNLSMVAHQYTVEKQKFYFEQLVEERNEKARQIAELKQQDADTVEVIEAMRKSIPHLFDHDDVLFTFLDLELYPFLADDLGLNIDGKAYKPGDTIVVSRNRVRYWDKHSNNEQLTNTREHMRQILRFLLSPSLVDKDIKYKSKLVGSPYHRHLRVADKVHQHGFLGYVSFLLTTYIVFSLIRKVLRRRRGAFLSRRTGIIGELFSKTS